MTVLNQSFLKPYASPVAASATAAEPSLTVQYGPLWPQTVTPCSPHQSRITDANLKPGFGPFSSKNPKLLSPGLFCLNYCYDLKAFCCLMYSVRDLKYRHNTGFL